jgi:hypothetical protein
MLLNHRAAYQQEKKNRLGQKKKVCFCQLAGQFEIAEKKIHQGVDGGRYCKVYL